MNHNSVASLRPLNSLLLDDSASSFQLLYNARDNSTSMTPAGTNINLSVHVPSASGDDDIIFSRSGGGGGGDGLLRLGYRKLSSFKLFEYLSLNHHVHRTQALETKDRLHQYPERRVLAMTKMIWAKIF